MSIQGSTNNGVGTAERKIELTLRPKRLVEYIGQGHVKSQLGTYIKAAGMRGDTLDHCLFYGPPGIGKTTLANIIANELGAPITSTIGPAVSSTADLISLLGVLEVGHVLFIDEIHRLSPSVEEVLYTAMEDFRVDVIIGSKDDARSVNVHLPKFTLIGATTKSGAISAPLRSRFGIPLHLDFYGEEDLAMITLRTAEYLGLVCDEEGAAEIARRGRGTPRIVNRMLFRVRDFAQVHTGGYVNRPVTLAAFDAIGIDEYGLEFADRKYLDTLIRTFNGGPTGVSSLAVAMSEEKDVITEVYEPYLIRIGFVDRTKTGRVATKRAITHMKVLDIKRKAGLGINTDIGEE